VSTFEFDDVVVDAGGFRIFKAGRPLSIEPKAFAVLVALLRRPGDLVGKDQLLTDVWAGTFVTANTLTRLVGQLRRVLGDTTKRPRYIETVHTRGYRFIGRLRTAGDGASPLAALRSASTLRATELPSRVTPLVGRDRDLQLLEDKWSTTRLLTLVGPGGVGKTQLALEHARRIAARYRDGVCFVDLAPHGHGTDVAAVVAAAFDLYAAEEVDGSERLAQALRGRQLLVLLDNCEHLMDSCARLATALLRACPDVHLLATSQRTFRIAGESVVSVAPLTVPPATTDGPADLAALAAIPSVRLFITRAQAARSSFALTAANAAAVREICRRLDGMPLSIELAAARVNVLNAGEIARRLDDRFNLLSGGKSDVARHQTFTAVMEWSTALLTPAERLLLSRLSVFAGGWSLEAAEAICTDAGLLPEHVFDLMSSLVNKSLVVVDADRDPLRYRLLETVRLYASTELNSGGQDEASRRRHFDYFLELARAADRGLFGPALLTSLDRLDREESNLTAALEWSVSAAAPDVNALELALALRRFWWYRSRYLDARHWLTRALQAMPRSPDAMHGEALIALATAEYGLSRWQEARTHVVDGLSLLPRQQRATRAFGLSVLASVADNSRDAASAERESMQLASKAKDPWLIGYACVAAGLRAAREQRHRRSAQCFARAARNLTATGDRWLIKFASGYEALQHHALGDQRRAAALASNALAIAGELQDRRAIAGCLEILGYVAVKRSAFELAARLLGAADALRDATGIPLSPSWSRLHERASATLARRFPLARATWQTGRVAPLGALIDEATTRLAN
jgi:predicted ATPase/DNA-binding winged helix-turn-helix (wHTH) protein